MATTAQSLSPAATEKPAISVRQFTPEDQSAVAKLFYDVMDTRFADPTSAMYHPWRDFAKKRLQTDLADIHAAYIAVGHNFWVAVATDSTGNERIVGMAGLERKSETLGEVRSVFVSVDHHRLGVGRALMMTLEEWARSNGFQRLFLTTSAENQKSRAFYESVGFCYQPHDPPLIMFGLNELVEYVKLL